MTLDPTCCTPHTTLDQVAKMMVQNNCGEIPVVDVADRPIGVVTDRDIVCRVVADGKNPMAHTAESCMSAPAVTVQADEPIEQVVATMEKHQIRRVPVVDERGCCAGIISQADVGAGRTAVGDRRARSRSLSRHGSRVAVAGGSPVAERGRSDRWGTSFRRLEPRV